MTSHVGIRFYSSRLKSYRNRYPYSFLTLPLSVFGSRQVFVSIYACKRVCVNAGSLLVYAFKIFFSTLRIAAYLC